MTILYFVLGYFLVGSVTVGVLFRAMGNGPIKRDDEASVIGLILGCWPLVWFFSLVWLLGIGIPNLIIGNKKK